MMQNTQPRSVIAASSFRSVGLWLALCTAMVLVMVMIGAITRLTESGLSMTSWRPVTGWLPPLTEAEWAQVFADYRETSQYALANAGMSLEGFKSIFWWEYIHRLWGRLIGLVYILPFLWFLWRRHLPAGYAVQLVLLLLMGGAQGAIGWWMVRSGFVDRVEVSQYRLAIHLAMALLIFGWLFRLSLDLLSPRRMHFPAPAALRRTAAAVPVIAFIVALAGALVAGMNAGLLYNEWPLMGGGFMPADYLQLQPWWLNFFENPSAVQFNHRIFAYILAAVVGWLWLSARRSGHVPPQARRAINALAVVVTLQITLGVFTLLLFVPIPLAVLHQAGALLTFACSLWVMREVRHNGAVV